MTAQCDKQYCYKSCRLQLLGGGRCTKAGCMCYHVALDFEGRPVGRQYPEDDLWYSLSNFERREILDVMRSGRPRRPSPPRRPGSIIQNVVDKWREERDRRVRTK